MYFTVGYQGRFNSCLFGSHWTIPVQGNLDFWTYHCKKTLDIISTLVTMGLIKKTKFFLSKADTVDSLSDLLKIVIQTTQNLTWTMKEINYDLRLLYLPRIIISGSWSLAKELKNLNSFGTSISNTNEDFQKGIPNALTEVCDDFKKVIHGRYQKLFLNIDENSSKLIKFVNEYQKIFLTF